MKSKYGVVFYQGSSNIGDDIQLYAAKRFLPQIDYIIERENMDSFVTDNYEKVKVIMNGWYFHKAESWPPTPFIEPKTLSMHFTDNLMIDGWSAKHPEVFDGYGKKFLKDHEPIGCRDTHTEKFMKELGIEHYFSSCLTTTISLNKKKKVENIIYAVDVSEDIVHYIEEHTSAKVITLTHIMTKEEQNQPFEERMKQAEKLLNKYHNAKMVVTSRLHAALPCLALETPVLLIKHDDPLYPGRLDTFYDFVHSITEEELLIEKVKVDFNKPKKNPTKYKKYREQLIADCEAFVKDDNCSYVTKEEYIDWLEKTKQYQKDGLVKVIVREHEAKKNADHEKEELRKRVDDLEATLESIYASRSYRWPQKLLEILHMKGR